MSRRALLAWIVLAAGCGAVRPDPWTPSFAAPYSDLLPADLELLRAARAHVDAAEPAPAWRVLQPLSRRLPDNIDVGVALQEVELELFAAAQAPGADVELDPVLAPYVDAGSPEASLRLRYAARAELAPSPAGYVLAARAETDRVAAQNLLDRAIELDSSCAWAHYGRAHVLLRRRSRYRWRDARVELDQALGFDPGHVHARRLQAWMLSQEGAPGAAAALELWLAETKDDPRVSAATRTEAQVDLAIRWVDEKRTDDAIVLLRSLEGNPVARARRLAVLAVAEHEEGQFALALDAARRARGADPSELLPLVQQGMLYEEWLDDPVAAEAKWREVIEAAQGQSDLRSLLQAFRARVALERAEAAENAAGGEPAPR